MLRCMGVSLGSGPDATQQTFSKRFYSSCASLLFPSVQTDASCQLTCGVGSKHLFVPMIPLADGEFPLERE
jgi:hypothetical protein